MNKANSSPIRGGVECGVPPMVNRLPGTPSFNCRGMRAWRIVWFGTRQSIGMEHAVKREEAASVKMHGIDRCDGYFLDLV